MIVKSEYYNYQEILDVLPTFAPLYPHQKDLSTTWFTDLLNDLSLKYLSIGLSDAFTENDIKEVINSLMTIVYDRHSQDYLFRHDSYVFEEDYTLTTDDVRKALVKLINVINLTLPRYMPMLKQYKNASGNPIAPITSHSIGSTKFNDTPQNIGDWSDEDHTTNISSTESESSVDTGSLMERLASLYKDYKSIILEWGNEFNQCFIKEIQLYE